MSTTTKGKMHSPAHPGEILREMYLKPMKVSVTEAARALGVSRKHVSAIVNGRAPVTPDMAMRLAAVFATEAQLWVNLQAQHDLWVVSEKTPPKVRPLRQAA
ncbi:MAG: HigA family addiction module antidote protein [Proteobacteria bacterium]|nr:HigA family addiction module antidote protein [Pseudomonadota bacterium]